MHAYHAYRDVACERRISRTNCARVKLHHLACRRLCRAPCPLLLVLWRRASRPSIPCCPPRSTRATDKLAYRILAQWRLGPASHPPTPQPRMRMHPPPWTDPQPHCPQHAPTDSPPSSPRAAGFSHSKGRPLRNEGGRQCHHAAHVAAQSLACAQASLTPLEGGHRPAPEGAFRAPTRILHLHMLAAKGTTTSAPYLSCLRAAWPPCAATRSRPILADPE
jgi:hypothetical protein